MAKYLATSLAIEKVVRLTLVIRSCFPIRTISISFVGEESRSTMLPASLAACFTDYRSRLSGNCAFVNGCVTLNHFTVVRNLLSCFHNDNVVFFKRCGRNGGYLFFFSRQTVFYALLHLFLKLSERPPAPFRVPLQSLRQNLQKYR